MSSNQHEQGIINKTTVGIMHAPPQSGYGQLLLHLDTGRIPIQHKTSIIPPTSPKALDSLHLKWIYFIVKSMDMMRRNVLIECGIHALNV